MLRISLDSFTRYGAKYYNANLVAINEAGAEYVIRIGEFTATERIAKLFDDAHKTSIINKPQIDAHLAIGRAEMLRAKSALPPGGFESD